MGAQERRLKRVEEANFSISWILICFLSVGNFNPQIFSSVPFVGSVNQFVFSVVVSLLAVRFILSVNYSFFRRDLIVLILTLSVLSFVSFTWSDDPANTLSKSIVFLFVPFAIAYSIHGLSEREILIGVAIGVGGALALSLVCILMFPEIAARGVVFASMDSWRGAFSQKNVLGRACMIFICAVIVLMYNRWMGIFSAIVFLPVAFLLLYKSQSATSVAGVLAFVPLFWALLTVHRFGRQWLPVVLIVLLTFGGIFILTIDVFIGLFSSALDKDVSFTGRVPLWSAVLQDWSERPILGFGTGGYFNELRIAEFTRRLGWDADNAHNGFLEALLDVGLLGLLLLIMSIYLLLKKSIVGFSEGKVAANFVCYILVILMVQNTMESAFMRPSNIIWVLFVAACIHVSDLRKNSVGGQIGKRK
ncbi:O-antigen ligase family protein [Pannonibacter phragmitetus]|nr:O-antigen ligase family protein [Pannonibacter phragmitetus]